LAVAKPFGVQAGGSMFDLDALREMPLSGDPFPYVIVPHFVRPAALSAISRDYPRIERPGSFPVSELTLGPSFAAFVAALEGEEFRTAVAEKFGVDLVGRPTICTVRAQARARDGRIHNDGRGKLLTVLIYMNESWEPAAGRLRLLRSRHDLEDVVAEIPPEAGTLLAFRVTDNSWHGHTSVSGPRRVVQFNWFESRATSLREHALHSVSARVKRVLSRFH
jgi:SM-20-related protein